MDEAKEKFDEELKEESDIQKLAHFYAFYVRHNKKMEVFTKLNSLSKKAKIQFGTEIETPFKKMFKIRRELLIATEQLIYRHDKERLFYDSRSDEKRKLDEEMYDKNQRTVWDTGENNDLNKEITSSINIVEKILAPYLK